MKITLSSGNRITIPKEIVNQLNLNQGQTFDLIITNDGNLLLNINNSNIEQVDNSLNIIQESKLEDIEDKIIKSDPTPVRFKHKIVSNLAESENFTRKVVSECGLLVRTKRSYLNKACEECQGYLAEQYGRENHLCKYLDNSKTNIESEREEIQVKEDEKKEDESKEVKADNPKVVIEQEKPKTNKEMIQNINNNINKLKETIDHKIDNIQKPVIKQFTKTTKHNESTNLEFVSFNSYKKCTHCKEYFNYGYLLNNEFYCPACTREDFIDFYEQYKKERMK